MRLYLAGASRPMARVEPMNVRDIRGVNTWGTRSVPGIAGVLHVVEV
jgi:hypothetical protein